jgi:hypothetical protein
VAKPRNPLPALHFDAILARISAGEFTEPVLRDLGIPKDTFRDYKNADEDRKKRYQEAKDDGEEMVVHECIAISDGDLLKQIRAAKDRVEAVAARVEDGDDLDSATAKELATEIAELRKLARDSADAVSRDKLRTDTRLKALAKFNPKRWGERTALSNPDGTNLLSGIQVTFVSPNSG